MSAFLLGGPLTRSHDFGGEGRAAAEEEYEKKKKRKLETSRDVMSVARSNKELMTDD